MTEDNINLKKLIDDMQVQYIDLKHDFRYFSRAVIEQMQFKTQFCESFYNRVQCKRRKCTFAHSNLELRSVSESDFYKNLPCPFELQEYRACSKYRPCFFLHKNL